jgi:hypothetical protein
VAEYEARIAADNQPVVPERKRGRPRKVIQAAVNHLRDRHSLKRSISTNYQTTSLHMFIVQFFLLSLLQFDPFFGDQSPPAFPNRRTALLSIARPHTFASFCRSFTDIHYRTHQQSANIHSTYKYLYMVWR